MPLDEEALKKQEELMSKLDSKVLGEACPFTEAFCKKIEEETLKMVKEAESLEAAELIIGVGRFRVDMMEMLRKRCKEIPEELEKKETKKVIKTEKETISSE